MQIEEFLEEDEKGKKEIKDRAKVKKKEKGEERECIK